MDNNQNINPTEQNIVTQSPVEPITVGEENIGMGVVGAIIGSLVGVAAIILFEKLGYVASLSGLVMAICTFKLYEKFAKKISKKGIIICVVVMIIMTLIGLNAAISLEIVDGFKKQGFDVGFMEVFKDLYKLIESSNTMGEYVKELLMVYAFSIIGAFGIIKNQAKTTK